MRRCFTTSAHGTGRGTSTWSIRVASGPTSTCSTCRSLSSVNALAEMSQFYEAMLHYERAWDRPGHVYLVDPSGLGPHVYLQQVPEPRMNKNRLHLDIVVPSLAEAVDQAVQLGASRVEER